MIGWVGNDMKDLSIMLYADADFAGCAQSLRSTSGSHMHIQGKCTRFPLAGGSKRQGCVSHSTPEAEIVAADVTLRTMGLPALSIWETLTESSPKLLFHDDNQGMIGVVRSGRNPTTRHLERTHGISIASLHEHFSKDHFVLMYEITAKMAADIHTKGFTNPLDWKKACMLINLLEPEDLGSKQLADLVQPILQMLTLQFVKFFSQGQMRFPIFHILKHPYCHLMCIVRVFQVEKSFKNYPVWIQSLWSKPLHYSEQDQLVSNFLQIAFGAPGS